MAHESLPKQVDAVVKMLSLLFHRIRVLVVFGVIRLANVVDAVEGVVDVQGHEIATLIVV